MTNSCKATVLQLFKEKKLDKLSQYVAEKSPDELQQALQLQQSSHAEFSQLTKALFKALELCVGDEAAASERRCRLVQGAIRVMDGAEISGVTCSEVMSVLSVEVSNLSDSALVFVFDTLMEVAHEAKIGSPAILELLDKLLSRDPKLSLAERLCSADWHRDNASPLAACLSELGSAQLSAKERESLVRKAVSYTRRVGISSLAGLLYHVFLFASKAGLLKLVISEVVEFFADLEGSSEKENSQTDHDAIKTADVDEDDIVDAEGTVLVHLLYTVRLCPALSSELLKVLRSLPLAQLLRPFSLALYFVLVSAHLEDDMHRPLRNIIAKYYQDQNLRIESIFLRTFAEPLPPPPQDKASAASRSTGAMDSIVAAFVVVAARAGRQWDNIVPGLVGFAFSCLEQQPPASASSTASVKAACRALNRLGRELLARLYRKAEATRESILSETVTLLLTTGGSPQLADLLRVIIARYPTLAVQHQEMLRSNLDCLLALPEPVAVATVGSLLPLLRWSGRLRDALVMCLRKCLYARAETTRRVAVRSLLLALRQFKLNPTATPNSAASAGVGSSQRAAAFRVAASFVTSSQQSSSQSSSSSQAHHMSLVDVHLPFSTASNECLCLEIVSMVNRLAAQMPQFLPLIYEELPDVCTVNPGLLAPFLGQLLARLDRLLVLDDPDQAPVNFGACLTISGGSVLVLEPLDQLLAAIQRLAALGRAELLQQQQKTPQQEESELVALVSRAEATLTGASRRLAAAELEELEVDESSEYCGTGAEAVRVCRRAGQLLGTFEALMLHEMASLASPGSTLSEGLSDRLVALYRQRKLLWDVIDKKQRAATAPAASTGAGNAAALAWPINPDACGQLRLAETCDLLCRALAPQPTVMAAAGGAAGLIDPDTRADLSHFLLERARHLLISATPGSSNAAGWATDDNSSESSASGEKQLAAIRKLCKASLAFYGHSVRRLATPATTATTAAVAHGVPASVADVIACPPSAAVNRCVHRVMHAALGVAAAVGERWPHQLARVSVNSLSLSENLRHWTAALVQSGEPKLARDVSQLAGLLFALSPGEAYLKYAESLHRSEALLEALQSDPGAASVVSRALTSLFVRNCLRHHLQSETHLAALVKCLRVRLGNGEPEDDDEDDEGDVNASGGAGNSSRRQQQKQRSGRRQPKNTRSGVCFPCVTRHTVDGVLQAAVAELGFAMDELDWLLVGCAPVDQLPAVQSATAFSLTVGRLELLSRLVNGLAMANLKPGSQTALVTRLATRHFRLMAALTRCLSTPSCLLFSQSPAAYADFERLVRLCGGEVAPQVYRRVLEGQVTAARVAREAAEEAMRVKKDKKKGGKGKKNATAAVGAVGAANSGRRRGGGGAKVDRDATAVPQLVYAVEQWEKALMLLCRRRSLGLMLHVKRAASRDFRIRLDEVQQVLSAGEAAAEEEAETVADEQEDADQDDDAGDDGNEDQQGDDDSGGNEADEPEDEPETVESTEPPRKRPRVQQNSRE